MIDNKKVDDDYGYVGTRYINSKKPNGKRIVFMDMQLPRKAKNSIGKKARARLKRQNKSVSSYKLRQARRAAKKFPRKQENA